MKKRWKRKGCKTHDGQNKGCKEDDKMKDVNRWKNKEGCKKDDEIKRDAKKVCKQWMWKR